MFVGSPSLTVFVIRFTSDTMNQILYVYKKEGDAMSKKYMIGVDIGTTATKAVLFEPNGAVMASHHVEYPLYSPTPDTAEQDPNEIFEAVVSSISHVMQKAAIASESILCVSFS